VRAGIPSPRKTRHVDPVYPEAARQARIEGVVVLEVLIDEGGYVQDARVLRSVALLDQAALEAVKQWRFMPSILDDQPVKVILTASVTFALRE
jgi:protein TonB